MASRERIGAAGTRAMSVVILLLGVAIVVRTVAAGGGGATVGVAIGVIFVAIGTARLYLTTRSSR
jgi:hypothetical protein